MTTLIQRATRKTKQQEYYEQLCELLPEQGRWTEADYLWLTEDINRFVEFTDGFLEFLPMPTDKHQAVLEFLFVLLHAHKPERDLVDKRGDYAEGCIPEYWIVNPQTETITVLRLQGESYVEHGVFGRGDMATSVILPGFAVNVDQAFTVDSPPDEDETEV